MWFPYFLKSQKDNLASRGELLKEKIKEKGIILTSNCHERARIVYDSYKHLHDKTIAPWHKIKSYIPGTYHFSLRLICCKRISELRKDLISAERLMKQLQPAKNVDEKTVTKSKSDSEVLAIRRKENSDANSWYANPINWPPRKQRQLNPRTQCLIAENKL
jgi:hypothetical protein